MTWGINSINDPSYSIDYSQFNYKFRKLNLDLKSPTNVFLSLMV